MVNNFRTENITNHKFKYLSQPMALRRYLLLLADWLRSQSVGFAISRAAHWELNVLVARIFDLGKYDIEFAEQFFGILGAEAHRRLKLEHVPIRTISTQ